jgi:hypothetical protein
MKSVTIALALLFTMQSWAQDARVFSSRLHKAGNFISTTSEDKGTVHFDGESAPTAKVWLVDLAPARNCDSLNSICIGNTVENTLTLSGNPIKGTVVEIFQHTETTIIGRTFTTDYYRIQFGNSEKILSGQYLRK